MKVSEEERGLEAHREHWPHCGLFQQAGADSCLHIPPPIRPAAGSRGEQLSPRTAAPLPHRKRPQTTTYMLFSPPRLRLPLRDKALSPPRRAGRRRRPLRGARPPSWRRAGGKGRHPPAGPGSGGLRGPPAPSDGRGNELIAAGALRHSRAPAPHGHSP